jgi:hypothetical protein
VGPGNDLEAGWPVPGRKYSLANDSSSIYR